MSKPLARYAGDEDLEAELRGKEREDDPMHNYMKKKRAEENKHIPREYFLHSNCNAILQLHAAN